ncbi:hypothetical protein T03_16949 [Trichinella britovi]|uniref:Uncharacterized protein n=1 Tax=Trichinella britovi TaxID=45882 RepID=A0A0V1AL69_TRIBR|nr:hypothetical protein T03_16949 [Trichinella britovi]
MNRFINTCLLDKIAACLVDGDNYVNPVSSCLVAASSPCGSHEISAVHNSSMLDDCPAHNAAFRSFCVICRT